jgi:hypothetical protein
MRLGHVTARTAQRPLVLTYTLLLRRTLG